MRILGISAYYHDSAAALLVDGKLVAAAQEERFTRRRHDAAFPAQAAAYCLRQLGKNPAVDYVVYYEKPFPKFERLLETWLAFAPRGFSGFRAALPPWLKEKLLQKRLLLTELERLLPGFDGAQLLFVEHHLSHAASAYYPSPFTEAAILTLDGVGEWTTAAMSVGVGRSITPLRELDFPHSLGLLYSAFTYYLGFKVNSGEYKLMGLAPYGEPRYARQILDHLIDLRDDGSFRLNLDYFGYCTGLHMTNERFHRLFGGAPRDPSEQITLRHMDVAASIQAVTEDVILRMARHAARSTGSESLCLAGGVALNCVANGRILRDGCFRRLWVQPAAGDAGGSVGAAWYAHHCLSKGDMPSASSEDRMQGAFLGPEFSPLEIESTLRQLGARYQAVDDRALDDVVSEALSREQVVGWFQGRMEFGPRALGNRSILADPRSPRMQSTLNLKVKFRESFRPFAPAVLREELAEWFDLEVDSPYMLLVAPVAARHRREPSAAEQTLQGFERLRCQRSELPAVTHVDGSARVQTVHRETNPRFHALLTAFHRRTGCPVLANTSFNVRGEPIVCTPEEAWHCFMGTDIDLLAIGPFLLWKKDQQYSGSETDYRRQFAPD